MKRIIPLLLLFCSLNVTFSQKESYYWTFGHQSGLDFNTPDLEPKAVSTSINTWEGCATISNAQGKLLFYTDGSTVYNKNHEIMQNGTGLKGNSSSTQSAIIVKQPGHDSTYYIFTVGTYEFQDPSLNYSIVDLSLQSGLGEVVTKNVNVNSFAIERLAAVPGINGTAFWIFTYNYSEAKFYSYKLTKNGLDLTPVNSPGANPGLALHYLRPNQSSNLLAAAEGKAGGVVIYEIDNSSGKLVKKFNLTNSEFTWVYGCEFSLDNSKLYVTNFNPCFIGQFDLSSDDETTIIKSFTKIATNSATFYYGALQMAPNKKIYVAKDGSKYVGVIEKPNLKAPNCNFIEQGKLLTGTSGLGLPTFVIQSCPDYNPNLIDTLRVCYGARVQVGNDADPQFDYSWTPPAIFENPTVSKTYAKLFYNNELILYMTNKNTGCMYSDTIHVIVDTSRLHIYGKNTFCYFDSTYLSVDQSFKNVKWSTGETGYGIWVNKTTEIFVTAENDKGCLLSDTIKTYSMSPPYAEIKITPVNCNKDSLEFTLSIQDTNLKNIKWSTGEVGYQITVHNTGTYSVNFKNSAGCEGFANCNLFPDTTVLQIKGDTGICPGDSTLLTVNKKLPRIKWSTGDSTYYTYVKSGGRVYVTTTDTLGCVRIDSIDIAVYPTPSVNIIASGDYCDFGNIDAKLELDNEMVTDVKWSNGDTTKSISVKDTGYYSVSFKNENGCKGSAGFYLNISKNKPVIDGNLHFCDGDSTKLYISGQYSKVEWSNDMNSDTIIVKQTDKISVIIYGNLGCIYYDTVDVEAINIPDAGFLIDGNPCNSDSIDIFLRLNVPDLKITMWSDGSSGDSLHVTKTGKYWARYKNDYGCEGYSEIDINKDTSKLRIYGDKEICEGDSTTLFVDDKFSGTKWSEGSTGTQIIVKSPGRYIATYVNQFGCTLSDTVDIIVHPLTISGIEQIGDFCSGNSDKIELKLKDSTLDIIKWSTGEISKSIFIQDTGIFWVQYKNQYGCINKSQIDILNKTSGTKILDLHYLGDLCKGSKYNTAIEMVNTYPNDIIIDSVYLSSRNSTEFKLLNPESYIGLLEHNDTLLFKFSYLPENAGIYSDTLIAAFRNPCNGEYRIPMQVNTLPAKINIGTIDTLVAFGAKLCIPILGNYLCDADTLLTTLYHITIKIDASLFVPDSVQFGKIDSMYINDGFYYITITDSLCKLSKNYSVINYLCGGFYKGNQPGSDIKIVDIRFDNQADINKTDGSIKGEICQFGIRGMELFDLNSLTVQPNPVTDQIKLNVINSDLGIIDFDIVNSVGNIVLKWSVNKDLNQSNQFELIKEINNLSTGMYIVRMRSASGVVTDLFSIVK